LQKRFGNVVAGADGRADEILDWLEKEHYADIIAEYEMEREEKAKQIIIETL
jgi:hypothetical protein